MCLSDLCFLNVNLLLKENDIDKSFKSLLNVKLRVILKLERNISKNNIQDWVDRPEFRSMQNLLKFTCPNNKIEFCAHGAFLE